MNFYGGNKKKLQIFEIDNGGAFVYLLILYMVMSLV